MTISVRIVHTGKTNRSGVAVHREWKEKAVWVNICWMIAHTSKSIHVYALVTALLHTVQNWPSGEREVWFCSWCLEIQKFLLNPQNERQWPLFAYVDCYVVVLWDKGTQLGKLLWPSQCQSELVEPSDKLVRLCTLPHHTNAYSDHMHPQILTSDFLVPNPLWLEINMCHLEPATFYKGIHWIELSWATWSERLPWTILLDSLHQNVLKSSTEDARRESMPLQGILAPKIERAAPSQAM